MLRSMTAFIIMLALFSGCTQDPAFVSRNEACAEQADLMCASDGPGCRVWYMNSVCQMAGAPLSACDQDVCVSDLVAEIASHPVLGVAIPASCSRLWLVGHL